MGAVQLHSIGIPRILLGRTRCYVIWYGGIELSMLMPIIKMADSISMATNSNGFNVMLNLDYYTHTVYLNGKLLRPENLET